MIQIPFLPTEGSTAAIQVDLIMIALLALSLFFLALVIVILVYSAVRFRRRAPDEIGHGSTGNSRLEWGGMAFLTTLALVIFFWAGGTYVNMFNPPADAEPVFVTGKQWMWKVQHSTGQREINSLHIPVGRDIKLIMTSEDVIHDFYVPAFRVHTDVVPGRYTEQWFRPTQVGTYQLFCSQYCGVGHSMMTGQVIVMTAADYQAWLAGGPQQSPAQAGAQLFQDLGCNACHRSDSLARAPNLVGLYGQPVRLNNGQTVTADDNYIRTSILNPSAQVVQGFQPIMPSFQGRVTEEQLFDLVAYVQSLGTAGGQPSPGGTTQPFVQPAASPPPGLPTSLPVQGGTPTGPTTLSTPSGQVPQPTLQPAAPNAPLGPTPSLGGTAGPAPASASAGEQLFTSQGCIGCHVANGSGVGPSFNGLFGKQQQLSNGQTVTTDEAFLRECMLSPDTTRIQGYAPVMPSFQGKLSDQQVNELIAYIKSLGGQ